MVEILKQNQYSPIAVEKQILIIFAGSRGLLDDIPLDKIKSFEEGLLEYTELNAKDTLEEIKSSGVMSEEVAEKLVRTIENFKQGFTV